MNGLLRTVVAVFALLPLVTIIVLILFFPPGGSAAIIDPGSYVLGAFTEQYPIYLYLLQDSSLTFRETPATGERFLEVGIPRSDQYLGFGVTELSGAPRFGARLTLDWRGHGTIPEFVVTLRERTHRHDVEYGEIFNGPLRGPDQGWTRTEFPLDHLEPSEDPNLDPDLQDGVLQTSLVRSVAFTFPPSDGFKLDIREFRFEWDGYNAGSLGVLAVLFATGLFLLIRMSAPGPPNRESELIRGSVLRQAGFSLISLSFLCDLVAHSGWIDDRVLIFYLVLCGLVLADEFASRRLGQWRVARLRFAAVLFFGWLFGVDLSPLAWIAITFVGYLPVLQFRDNLMLFSLPVLGLGGYLLGDRPNYPDLALGLFVLAGTFVIVLLSREALSLAERRVRAEERLLRSEAIYREIFNAVDEGILLVEGETGRIVQSNEAAARLLGCSCEGLVTKGICDLVQEGSERVETALHSPAPSLHELHVRRCDGSSFWAEMLAQRSSVGGEERGLLVIRDIEERRRLESQLRHSQKMEAVGNLAGGVAHDFNNLLMIINGRTELALAADRSGAGIQEDLEEIRMAGLRAARLVEKLLAFSRKLLLDLRRVDLSEFVSALQPNLSRLAGEGIRQEYEYGVGIAPVLADTQLIERVLENFVSNARNAMPNGGQLRLSVRNRRLDASDSKTISELDPGTYVEVRVSDSGRGMDPDTVSRIFDPFFTTEAFGRGAGLGLSTVYGIVRQHNGSIQVESAPGRGTTFSILFPCAGTEVSTASLSAPLS